MKKKILKTIQKLREDGLDFKETPALFNWVYPEEPTVQIQMLLGHVESDVTNKTIQ